MIFNCVSETTHYIKAKSTENKLMGAISINQTESECIIHSLQVWFRRHGVGLSMFIEAEHKIKTLGYDKAYLYVEKNTWVHNWYKRLGFRDTNEPTSKKKYVKMVKELDLNGY
jgi:N-acetylglutamate synthase-like GNAT family acetyltransferase